MDSRETARAIVEESIVLLKNEGNLLPLAEGTKAAFFGRTQEETIFSGNGSGAAHVSGSQSILDACQAAGLIPEPNLAAFYREKAKNAQKAPEIDFSKIGEFVNSGLMYEIFGKYNPPAEEYALTDEQVRQAKAFTKTAILVLGRNSGGEECDRHLEGDYFLTASEQTLIDQVCAVFKKVILILNVNGAVDLSWLEDKEQIKSVLFVGIPGQEGPAALADILTGKVNPSGRLAFTAANRYSDYPTAEDFTWDKDRKEAIRTYETYGLDAEENGSHGFDISPVTVYREDIFLGYRYFDSFGIAPQFPFGFGLSYTDFEMETASVNWNDEGLILTVRVKNTGSVAGKEVVQCYLAAHTEQNRPARKLVGFEKTNVLEAGISRDTFVFIPWQELASFDEQGAAEKIGRGEYLLLLGESSRSLQASVNITIPEDVVLRQLANRLSMKPSNREKLQLPKPSPRGPFPHTAPWQITISEIALPKKPEAEEIFPVVDTLSDLELASLCVGYGPGIPFAPFLNADLPNTAMENGRPVTENSHPAGFNGYVSPAIPDKGIRSVFYKDGPAGVGETAWPTEMLMACSFNKQLWYAFGDAVGAECEKQQIDVWLAPAVNLQRNPLGGRNFEYFSEDPLLAGTAAAAAAKGCQENHNVLVCPKHFAVNEQETFRRGSARRRIDAVDSILTEQALREIYLKPFRMLVEEAGVRCLMTSFNKINGTFAGGSADLCTHILREEWGFRGAVVTDWGDMDIVVDGADAVAAGNDVVMPGGPPVIEQIMTGLKEGRVTRAQLVKAVNHLLTMTSHTAAGKTE